MLVNVSQKMLSNVKAWGLAINGTERLNMTVWALFSEKAINIEV